MHESYRVPYGCRSNTLGTVARRCAVREAEGVLRAVKPLRSAPRCALLCRAFSAWLEKIPRVRIEFELVGPPRLEPRCWILGEPTASKSSTSPFSLGSKRQTTHLESWSGRGDLNARPPAPKELSRSAASTQDLVWIQ